MSDLPLLRFNPSLPRLSASEKAVLKLLVEAVKLVAPLYLEQENQAKKSSLSKEEIDKAGKIDLSIISPYSVLEKVNGKIIATPYHVKYAKFLKPISDKLNQASSLTDNKAFGAFLRLKAKAMLDGTYENAIASWFKMKPYILDIGIGPFEHLDDKLFFAKATYQAWVGVLDQEGTERLNNYKSIVLSSHRKALIPKERIDNLDKVKAKVIDVLLFSGLMARTKFVGVNLPVDVKFVQKYGSEITLFNQPNDLRVKEQILPIFNEVFPKAFKDEFDSEDLSRGYLRNVAMHELAHSYLYKNAPKNLQDLFQPIYETASSVLGFRMAGSLLLKDRITSKQLESMIVTYLCRCLYLMKKKDENKSLINYALTGSIFVNFLIESGALKEDKGLLIPNFMKIFVSLPDLSNILENLLSNGTRKEAESFIKKYI